MGYCKVISLNSGAHSNMVEETNIMFGTTLYSKVVSLFNMAGCQQATGGIFGQINPMMFMLMMDKSEDGDGGDIKCRKLILRRHGVLFCTLRHLKSCRRGGMFNGLGGMQNQ